MIRLKRSTIFLLCFLAAASAWSCWYFFLRDVYKPLHRLAPRDVPLFADDGDSTSLFSATIHQFAILSRKAPAELVSFGEDEYPVSWLQESLQTLMTKLADHPAPADFQQFIQNNFIVYQAGGRPTKENREMLVTGYYEPVFEGSLERKDPYMYPIYRVPDSLIVQKGGSPEIVRRNEQKQLVPFWSRAEIEENNYLAGYELVFLKDPIDAYLLHVQGSGRIRLPDGSLRAIRFAGSNGLEYRSIGKFLVDKRIMPLEQVTMVSIRKYLKEHPEEQQRVLHQNPRYIFFTWGDNRGPRGSSGEILTPGRSAAMDFAALPFGAIGYLQSRCPIADEEDNLDGWQPLNRFIFAQDTGAAIQGTGRLDIFWGNGPYAELASNNMKEAGKLFFLVKKGYQPPLATSANSE
jgi:membrane-bound lytic murein transglycosylase A